MRRYRVARAMGNYEEVVGADKKLLERFGLRLLAAECGIHAAVESELKADRVNPWNTLTLEEKTWDWLRPILTRLDTLETLHGAHPNVMAAK